MNKKRLILGYFLAISGLLLTILFTYQNIEKNTFQFDDFDNIVHHQPVRMVELSLDNLLYAAQNSFLSSRPLPSITYALDWWRGAGEAESFLQTNLFIHFLTTTVFFLLLYQIIYLQERQHSRQLLIMATLLTLIWAIHPLQSQATTYIVQRMTSMAALFTLLSVFTYIKFRLTKTKKSIWLILLLISFVLGISSKENAYIIPLLILLTEYGVCRHNKPLTNHIYDKLILAIPVLITLFICIDLFNPQGVIREYFPYSIRTFTLEERLLTQPRVIIFHFSQFFWPVAERFSVEHSIEFSQSLLIPQSTLAAIIFVLIWIMSGIYLLLKQNYRLWGFFLLWMPITLSIESSFIPLEMIFEHRMYLPLFGLIGLFMLIIVKFKQKLLDDSKTFYALSFLMLGAIAYLSYVTQQRLTDWQSKITLLESAIDNAPKSDRMWGGLSRFYYKEGRLNQSIQAAQNALQINPLNLYALETMGVIYMDRGQLQQAEKNLSYVLSEGPDDIIFNHWGELKLMQGHTIEAISAFNQAIIQAPWDATYHWNIALSYERNQNCPQAHGHWLQFINLSADKDPEGVNEVRQHLLEIYQTVGGKCYKYQD